jgi:hypothetical protein
VTYDPFRVLGLPLRPDLTDDDVRAAWRRIAAATHPDRADGGDPGRYAEAAAAYTTVRTASGRGEAYADLITSQRGLAWVWRGRPIILGLRIAVAAAVSAGAVAVAGTQPAAIALIVGAATWLVRTGHRDIASPAASRAAKGRRRTRLPLSGSAGPFSADAAENGPSPRKLPGNPPRRVSR